MPNSPRPSHCRSFEVLTTRDVTTWRSIVPTNVSVFGGAEFASITERHAGSTANLFVYHQGDEVVVYPFFVRSVSDLPFAAETPITACDILSPEYTGPLVKGNISQSTATGFQECFAAYCQQRQIVAEFAHLHPWGSSAELLVRENVRLDREIVYVDLTKTEEQLWNSSLSYACRKNIKRANKEGVRVYRATEPADVEKFYRIYVRTMDRRQALRRYHFPLSYFLELFQQMRGNAAFLLAEYKDQVVAATLYLHDDTDVYSYLGGADETFQHVRPTNAVIYEAMRWAQGLGKKRLILGGGYQPDDGIFRFKAGFSPLRAKFYVYKHVQMPEEYDALCRAWSEYHGRDVGSVNGYFPAYRWNPS